MSVINNGLIIQYGSYTTGNTTVLPLTYITNYKIVACWGNADSTNWVTWGQWSFWKASLGSIVIGNGLGASGDWVTFGY